MNSVPGMEVRTAW